MTSGDMTEEQRARLLQWQQEQTPMSTEVPLQRVVQPDVQRALKHMRHELAILQECSDDEETLIGLVYYGLAVADLEYFLEHGVSLREDQSAQMRGHMSIVITRESVLDGNQEK